MPVREHAARRQFKGRGGTYVQGLQAVPAESMLAVLAHHLGTTFVSLDVYFTFRTALDRSIVVITLKERTATETDRLSSTESIEYALYDKDFNQYKNNKKKKL